jgi:antitoxin YefM
MTRRRYLALRSSFSRRVNFIDCGRSCGIEGDRLAKLVQYPGQVSQQGGMMRVINFSDARNQFKQVIDQVVADCDVTIISRRDAEDAVVMSLDTYNSMIETFHLVKSPANVKHLEKSLAQYRKGQTKVRPLRDAK